MLQLTQVLSSVKLNRSKHFEHTSLLEHEEQFATAHDLGLHVLFVKLKSFDAHNEHTFALEH